MRTMTPKRSPRTRTIKPRAKAKAKPDRAAPLRIDVDGECDYPMYECPGPLLDADGKRCAVLVDHARRRVLVDNAVPTHVRLCLLGEALGYGIGLGEDPDYDKWRAKE